ncbi:MAG TPA: beta-N-acetylhexosaminidase [Acidimicrobiales bacterium]|nr:beta-N-acetylhexosaminidase [Acidimicrobiales bacterium]
MNEQQVLGLVPEPASMQRDDAGCALRPGSAVITSPEPATGGHGNDGRGAVARLLARELSAATGWDVAVTSAAAVTGVPNIELVAVRDTDGRLGPEGYRLASTPTGVRIEASEAAGAFYGTRTLLQLLPPDLLRAAPVGKSPEVLEVPGLRVEDRPRFAWRGMGLDVSRHYMPKHFILRLVDLAALHKLNTLHLHLTDDQGWRIQIDKYPRLTAVGAWRRESPLGHYRDARTDGTPHGGFYTKADLAEIVAYAAARFVNVVPEIDMPGHMRAAIAAYPELGNTGEQLEVFTNWGISEDVLNMQDSTVRFCTDVLEEVMGVFPSRYIHIGGDECPTRQWETSPRARARASELGLGGPEHLQGWFTSQIGRFLADHGRALVGWDEILDAGAPQNALITVWRGEEALRVALTAARTGHDVVMAPEPWAYFDWSYADDPREPVAIRPAISVEKAYSFEPVPEGLEREHAERVIGAQCQLWTEYVNTPAHAEYMYFPRVCAFSEKLWSPAAAGWDDFEQRLGVHLRRLAAMGVNYRPLDGPTPGQARLWEAPA